MQGNFKERNGLYTINRFKNNDLTCTVQYDGKATFLIEGFAQHEFKRLVYVAPAPPDRHMSYFGSCLPFPNIDVAISDTPNRGSVDLANTGGKFSFKLLAPNSYYTGLGRTLNPPMVSITLLNGLGQSRQVAVKIPVQIPNKSLTSLPGRPNRTTRMLR